MVASGLIKPVILWLLNILLPHENMAYHWMSLIKFLRSGTANLLQLNQVQDIHMC